MMVPAQKLGIRWSNWLERVQIFASSYITGMVGTFMLLAHPQCSIPHYNPRTPMPIVNKHGVTIGILAGQVEDAE